MNFLADENFDNRILRGLLHRQPNLDIVRVQDLEIAGADDPTVLDWAEKANRILLTHDQKTIPAYAYEKLEKDERIAGVIIVNDNLAIRSVIEDIVFIIECSTAAEWVNQVQYLPL